MRAEEGALRAEEGERSFPLLRLGAAAFCRIGLTRAPSNAPRRRLQLEGSPAEARAEAAGRLCGARARGCGESVSVSGTRRHSGP